MGEVYPEGVDGIKERVKEKRLGASTEMAIHYLMGNYVAYNLETICLEEVFSDLHGVSELTPEKTPEPSFENQPDVQCASLFKGIGRVGKAIQMIWDKESPAEINDPESFYENCNTTLSFAGTAEGFQKFLDAGSIATWRKRLMQQALISVNGAIGSIEFKLQID